MVPVGWETEESARGEVCNIVVGEGRELHLVILDLQRGEVPRLVQFLDQMM